MKNNEFSRSYLENLTTEELLIIADRLNIEIPPDLAWNFIIEAVLETQQQTETISRLEASSAGGNSFAPDAGASLDIAVLHAAVQLPEQYNITFIDVLIRDPLWAYVFWEIKSHDREMWENRDFNGYCLKITQMSDAGLAFIMQIPIEDNAWYVAIPNPAADYRADLCARAEGREVLLASSGVFTMPKIFDLRVIDRTPLHLLSGVEEFPIIRSRERDPQ